MLLFRKYLKCLVSTGIILISTFYDQLAEDVIELLVNTSAKLVHQIAFNCFTIGCLAFLKTLNPQMHLISGSLDNSSTDTPVPQRMHS